MKSFRFIWISVCTFILCSFLGLFLMFAVSCLPSKPIDQNVRRSAYMLEKEYKWPAHDTINGKQLLDNFTDTLMLGIAAGNADSAIEEALSCRYPQINSMDPFDSFVAYFNRPDEHFDSINYISYARYWHGYLVLLKPLLLFFRYYQIRKILLYSQLFLVISIVFFMFRRKLGYYVLPFLLSIALLSPRIIALSLQFSWVYYITLLSCLLLLMLHRRFRCDRFSFVFFAAVGCATSFVDLLTAPLLTLAFPLTFYLITIRPSSMRDAFTSMLRLSICWGLGYVGMWAGKWVLASLLTNNNVIADALSSVNRRTSFVDEWGVPFVYSDILSKNWMYLKESPLWYVVTLIMLAGILLSFMRKRGHLLLIALCSLGMITIFPFLWYFMASNHSFWHASFTSRILVCIPFAGMCMSIFPHHTTDIQSRFS